MFEFEKDWLRANKGLIALAILLLPTASVVVWKWQRDRRLRGPVAQKRTFI